MKFITTIILVIGANIALAAPPSDFGVYQCRFKKPWKNYHFVLDFDRYPKDKYKALVEVYQNGEILTAYAADFTYDPTYAGVYIEETTAHPYSFSLGIASARLEGYATTPDMTSAGMTISCSYRM